MGSHNGDGQESRGSRSPSASGSLGGGVSVEASSSSANSVGGSSLGADSGGLTAEGSSGAVGSGRAIPAPRWLGKRVGRFRLLALLGQGAMGRVFRAEDTLMGRHVALKLLPRTVKKGNTRVGPEMLIREAKAAAAIEHPNAVAVYEVNQAGDVCYVAMELLEGGSLRDLVRAAGPMDLTRACLLCAEAAEALAAAHSAGVVHRDVKPANLMLSRNGRCKVVDFGLARLDDTGRGGEWANGSAAESVGTPQFIAPEILSGTPASAASDIYSLGGTLFYLLTGRPPFEAPTARELLKMHVSAPVPDLRSFRPEASRGLADAIAKALAKRPAERWSSMEQFARVLRVHAIPIAAGAAPADGSGIVGGIPPVADYGSGSGLGSGYAPPPTPAYFPAGPATDPWMPANRPARPASPITEVEAEVESAPPEVDSTAGEPQPEVEVAYVPEASEPATSEAIEEPVPHGQGRGLVAWPLLAGGGVLIAAVVAVLCIVFLKAPPKDVASNPTPANTPPASTNTPPAPTPAATAPPATATPPTAPAQQAEELPPSLVAQWVADDYTPGSKWVDQRNHIAALPKHAPKVVPGAFNGHAGVQLNGTNQYFVLRPSDCPLSGGRTMTVVAVFKPQADKQKGHHFWEGEGLVGADMENSVDDWGMAWGGDSGTRVVAGVGNFPLPKDGKAPGDFSIPSPDVNVNRVHVAVMTWDFIGSGKKGRGTLTLYVDGVPMGTRTDDAEPRLPRIPIALGAADAAGKRPFQGLLAEVRLYNDTRLDPQALSTTLLNRYDADPRSDSPFDQIHLLDR